jgi:hypothetical protein
MQSLQLQECGLSSLSYPARRERATEGLQSLIIEPKPREEYRYV